MPLFSKEDFLPQDRIKEPVTNKLTNLLVQSTKLKRIWIQIISNNVKKNSQHLRKGFQSPDEENIVICTGTNVPLVKITILKYNKNNNIIEKYP